jgi:hypothetical protein
MTRTESEIFDGDPSFDEFFKDVKYFVKGDSFSQREIWSRHHDTFAGGNWGQKTGTAVIIGHIARRPIAVSLMPVVINGFTVIFYYGCSQLVDHKMVDEFIDMVISRFKITTPDNRRPECDATNFGHCYHTLLDISKIETA